MIYQINEAVIGFPTNPLLNRVSFEIRNTEKISIVGRNGCGKTTFLRVIAGKHETDNVSSDEDFFIHKKGNLRVGYLEQMSFENEHVTVREELEVANPDLTFCRQRIEALTKKMEEDPTDQVILEFTRANEQFELLDGYTYKAEMEQIFTKFGFDMADMERPIDTFSGGQKTKIAFAKLLLSKPDICLLDEPTNHLDLPTIEWLEGYLKNYKHAVVIVSHDRMFLDRITDVTYEIEHQRMTRYVGNYTEFVKQKRLNYEKQWKDYEAQQKEIARLTEFIEKWKNTPTKVSMTRSKKMQIEHMVKIEKPMRYETKAIVSKFQPRKSSMSEVLNVKKLKLGYTSELAEVSFQLRRGERLAILGENGRGKSTLLKTIVGQIKPFSPKNEYLQQDDEDAEERFHEQVRFGGEVEWAYFDQELLNLDESKTVIEDFWDMYPKLLQTEVRTILGNFLFSGDDVFQPVATLSGGERVRLSLAKMMRKQANLLILDEPTNHLDMIGKEALESILRGYEGTILFVSHDRYFVKSVATKLLMFEHGEVNYYPFDYETFLEKGAEKNERASYISPAITEKGQHHEVSKKENGNSVGNFNEKENKSETVNRSGGINGLYRENRSGSQEPIMVNSSKEKITPVLDAKEDRLRQKEQQRKERRLQQLEAEIEEQEKLVHKWKMKFTDPEIAADYEKLDEINAKIVAEEEKLNELLMEWSGLV